jgi:hypothetical protein
VRVGRRNDNTDCEVPREEVERLKGLRATMPTDVFLSMLEQGMLSRLARAADPRTIWKDPPCRPSPHRTTKTSA